MKKMQHCYYCGEELGVYDKPSGEFDTCGRRECEREARYDAGARDADARWAAEEDGYARYR